MKKLFVLGLFVSVVFVFSSLDIFGDKNRDPIGLRIEIPEDVGSGFVLKGDPVTPVSPWYRLGDSGHFSGEEGECPITPVTPCCGDCIGAFFLDGDEALVVIPE